MRSQVDKRERDRDLRALLLGLALLALTLRGSITSVGPLLPEMKTEVPLSTTLASVLTALPLVCFALIAAVAPRVLRRYPVERVIVVSLGTLSVGLTVRIVPGIGPLLAGTIVLASAIAILNVLLPVLVKRGAPHRAGLVTGAYVMALSFGAALGAGVTVPFADAVDRGWRPGLALWLLPVIPALIYWSSGRRRSASPTTVAPPAPTLGGIDWPVTLFFGLQSGVFYAAVSWLPSVLQDQGVTSTEAGALVSVSVILGIPTALAAPVIAGRRADQRPFVAGSVAAAAAGLLGLAVAPDLALLWMVLFGIGIGATFPIGLTLIVSRSANPREAEQRSSTAQTLGYALAIAGPLLVGAMHSLTGEWTIAVAFLGAVMLVPTMASGLAAARTPEAAHSKQPG